jgi:hypothetical protein
MGVLQKKLIVSQSGKGWESLLYGLELLTLPFNTLLLSNNLQHLIYFYL